MKDRTLALFALAATDAPQATSCPNEETLAQFIDGRLTGQGRETMLAHLNRCRACYHHWLEVAAYLTSSEAAASAPGNTRPAASLWQRLQIWFGDWSIAVPVAASAVVVFALVLGWPRSPDLNAELDLAYAKLSMEHAAQASLPLPWEGAALGFSESQASAPRQAFGAGLWAGKRALSDSDKETLPEFLSAPGGVTWPETAWADYYALGRWMTLVWTLAASDQGKADWHEQAAIGQRLLSEWSKEGTQPEEEAGRATAALERLQAPLAALEREANPGSRAELRRSLEIAMQQLAP